MCLYIYIYIERERECILPQDETWPPSPRGGASGAAPPRDPCGEGPERNPNPRVIKGCTGCGVWV